MKVQFIAEIVDDDGNIVKSQVAVESEVPDVTEFREPEEFYQVFDRVERPVIEARNQIAAEIAKEYLEEASFFKNPSLHMGAIRGWKQLKRFELISISQRFRRIEG